MRDVVSRILAGEAFTLTNYQRDLATISPHIPYGRYSAVNDRSSIRIYCTPCGELITPESTDVADLNAAVHAHNAKSHYVGDDR